jgi:hypothetical protein
MPRQTVLPSELDSPWKDALDRFLRAFLNQCFPTIENGIAWPRGYQALDKEFQQIIRKGQIGKRLADKLFKVWTIEGEEYWLLIHIEVQGQPEGDFAERMFVYNYRAYDLYNRPVVSLAVLCDPQPDWRPDRFAYERWGCTMGIQFPMVKLLDYADRSPELEKSTNPFASIVLAHLKALETRQDALARHSWKVRLVKGLYERGWDAEDVRQLFRLIDWILDLPVELQERFREEIYRHEEDKRMPYLSSFERQALEKGLQKGREEGREEGEEVGLRKGLLQGIEWTLESKFGPAGRKVLGQIRLIKQAETLRRLGRAIKRAKRVADVQTYLSKLKKTSGEGKIDQEEN